MKNSRSKALKGYGRRDSISHRTYNFATSVNRYKKTGKFNNKGSGLGHKAGYKWAKSKEIDSNDSETKYSKNSPSFDEGVHQYKDKMKKALDSKK